MNRCLLLAGFAVLVLVGCNKGTPPSGAAKPGATDAAKTTGVAELGNRIEIVASPIRVEKGKTSKLTVTATRKNTASKETHKEEVMYKESWYQGAINLKFDTSDATGLKIDPAVIPAGADHVEVPVVAGADASGGLVDVTATGGPGVEPFTIRVRADVR